MAPAPSPFKRHRVAPPPPFMQPGHGPAMVATLTSALDEARDAVTPRPQGAAAPAGPAGSLSLPPGPGGPGPAGRLGQRAAARPGAAPGDRPRVHGRGRRCPGPYPRGNARRGGGARPGLGAALLPGDLDRRAAGRGPTPPGLRPPADPGAGLLRERACTRPGRRRDRLAAHRRYQRAAEPVRLLGLP